MDSRKGWRVGYAAPPPMMHKLALHLTCCRFWACPQPCPPSLADTPAETSSTSLADSIDRKRVSPPAVLAPPDSKKMKGDSKQQSNNLSRKNPWFCTCLPVWPSAGGRAWHQSACPRQRYVESGGTHCPAIGDRVTVMACAGGRAGQVWECVKVQKDGWRRVL